MKLKTLSRIPPWEWPDGTDEMLLEVLSDRNVAYSERLLAAEMAGDYTVVNDKLAEALLAILRSADEPEAVQGAMVMSGAESDDEDDEF